jgi:spermidine synthase
MSRTRVRLSSVALLLGLGLFASGSASLVNQVVWEASLRRFLGGAETTCAMVIVLVFMAGLGFGSALTGRYSGRLRRPLFALAALEATLALVNLGVRSLLSRAVDDSVFRLQAVASSLGVPLLLLYAVSAGVLLVVPCLLMGATLPLASEVLNRRLGLRDTRVIGLLFGINTFGAVLGSVVGAAYLIPILGHSSALGVAVALNLGAALLLLCLCAVAPAAAAVSLQELPSVGGRPPKPVDLWLVFGLGFCSLGYEMTLLRLAALRDASRPLVFAAVISGFLLYWSVGAALSAIAPASIRNGLRLGALSLLACFLVLPPHPLTGLGSVLSFWLTSFPRFLPCVLFGYLFSSVTARASVSWGADVGRLSAANTFGCCLGVLVMTLGGYEIRTSWLPVLLALGLWLLSLLEQPQWRRAFREGTLVAAFVAALVLVDSHTGLSNTLLYGDREMEAEFFDRNGVIGIDRQGIFFWDGLWHSRLAKDGNHVGSHNWRLSVFPFLCHSGPTLDVAIIGMGTGISAATLAEDVDVRRVDVYEINRTITKVLRRYPEGTLRIGSNPKVRVRWTDARTGLALNPDRYDLIMSQPVYLLQAGSATLNSVEFLRLVGRRLKPGGVFCQYSNGTPAQAFAVRQAAARVFPYHVSFFAGYQLILSNDPIDVRLETLRARFSAGRGPLWEEIRGARLTRDAETALTHLDGAAVPWGDGRLAVTDDRPLLEYPELLAAEVVRLGYREALPEPR